MGASASFSVSELTVVPGAEARLQVRVRNTGTVVDQFHFEVLGPAAAWIAVEPAVLPLFPGAEGTAEVVVRPPRLASTTAGRTPFAVKVTPQEDRTSSVVEEGVVDVQPFDEWTGELIPRTTRGRRGAWHDIAIDNRGNQPIDVRFSGIDPEGSIGFEFVPPGVVVAPGTAQFARARVRPPGTFWRGAPRTHAFLVQAEREHAEPLPLDGTMVQEPILPRWFWKAVAALLLVIIALVILWFTLLKPSIRSTAKDVVKPVEDRIDAASIPTIAGGGGGGNPAGGGGKPTTTTTAAGGGTSSGGNPTTTTTTTDGGTATTSGSVSPLGNSIDKRIQVSSSAPTAQYTVPAGKVLSITDIVLQNPQGDSGRLRIKRNGDILVEIALENFRTQDLHYVSPLTFAAGQNVVIEVACTAPGPADAPSAECVDAVSFSGFIK